MPQSPRITARGKFLFRGDEKFYVRGVTYGTFRPDASGEQYPRHEVVERDFALMSLSGINSIRTYTPPPRWLLDLAHRYGIYVMVGIPWPQHLLFLDDRSLTAATFDAVRTTVARCAGHPALLAFAIGNEIPATIVRWYGRLRVERFLRGLYKRVRAIDAQTPITYVNFPTTEYLHLPFLDFVAFNVYLEDRAKLGAYLGRLQNIAGDRPLVMAEIGLDSRRNGDRLQSESLAWQLDTAFEVGCAGAFVFAWTDEWYRGGFEIDDWDFGLTTRDRTPKPALDAVRSAFRRVPACLDDPPLISVVVCSFNGARTIRECLSGIERLRYPSFEVIVVDDGSHDDTPAIAREFAARVISTGNHGLSSARNTGWQHARGEIVAYIDDDATPDPDWLTFLALGYRSGDFGGMGGPNIQPPDDRAMAHCVASAPGGPIHVLLDDRVAEHIPGCNMSFRRTVLEEIGGFDARFRIAGDDVDVCWRVQQSGHRIGFHPGAMVWHHRRDRLRVYWKQQRNYGRAEAMLERKWPEKYNRAGHASWQGRLYGQGHRQFLGWHRGRVYQGMWGTAPFQSEEAPAQSLVGALPLMPEWHLVIVMLSVASALGLVWRPMLAAVPLLAVSLGVVLVDATIGGIRARIPRQLASRNLLRFVTAYLYFIQPIARLVGRIGYGLTPWRLRSSSAAVPVPRTESIWSERWREPADWIERISAGIRRAGGVTRNCGPYDRSDLLVRGGLVGSARVLVAIEEHGGGRQYVRVRLRPVVSRAAAIWSVLFATLAFVAWTDSHGVAFAFVALAVLTIAATTMQCASAIGVACDGLSDVRRSAFEDVNATADESATNRQPNDDDVRGLASVEGRDDTTSSSTP